ncbi:MAG: hypothetical protein ACEQSK_06895 [Sphingomonadaceae bacterium]
MQRKPARRVDYGTFSTQSPIVTYGEDDRPNPSKPPPAHAPNFPERYFQPDAIIYQDPQDENF